MAIRPVDLQLAYIATPQNAAVASSAQEAPQLAQQASQAAFAAEVVRRSEHVDEPPKIEHAGIRTKERGPRQQHEQGGGKRRAPDESETEEQNPLRLAGEGEHFIDFTA